MDLPSFIPRLFHYAKNVQIWSFSGWYFPVFGLNTGKYGPEKTPYLVIFHAVSTSQVFCKMYFLLHTSVFGAVMKGKILNF